MRPSLIEHPFRMRQGGLDLRGRIDAVYGEHEWEIVDFKTGTAPADLPRREASLVQLQAYAIAAAEGFLGQPLPDRLDVTFSYLGSPQSEVTYVADDTWLLAARERIAAITEGIRDGIKQPTPSAACHTCDFLHFCDAGQMFVDDR
jgi:RecB family exonuclease